MRCPKVWQADFSLVCSPSNAPYRADPSDLDVAHVGLGLLLSPLKCPPLPWWLTAMRVNANATRCRPSLGVDILVAEGGRGPRPAGTYHQRLEVVLVSKADRDWTVILLVVIDLVARHRAAGNEPDESLCRQGAGIPVAVVAGCPFSGASMPNKRTR
jgi:hypothetical protein